MRAFNHNELSRPLRGYCVRFRGVDVPLPVTRERDFNFAGKKWENGILLTIGLIPGIDPDGISTRADGSVEYHYRDRNGHDVEIVEK